MDQSHENKEKDITQYYYIYEIRIIRSKINFYDQNAKLMSSCADFYRSNQTSPATFFQIKDIDNMLISLHYCEYKTSLCPLLFKNSRIYYLTAFVMMNTFYKKNVLKFSDDFDEKREDLNSHIYIFIIENAYNIDLDSSFLNKHVFAKTTNIRIKNQLNSIQTDLFKSFYNLFEIRFSYHIKKLIHKQGIKWITFINSHLNVNLSDLTNNYFQLSVLLSIRFSKLLYSDEQTISYMFPNEDFCLYKDFPFNQLVILAHLNFKIEYSDDFFDKNINTCTYLWLIRYFPIYIQSPSWLTDWIIFNKTIEESIKLTNETYKEECNFNRMLNKCDSRKFQVSKYTIPTTNVDIILNFIFSSHFIFILSFCISFLGLFSNFTLIFVISHKQNKLVLKELKHFHYMRLNAIFNSLIFIIRILSLMSECYDYYFLYCSSIHRLVAIQLEKMIFSEFLGNTFRYMSSLSFIAFTLSRISLLGQDHGKIVTWISELSMKKFISYSLFFSISFCFVKFSNTILIWNIKISHFPLNFMTFLFSITIQHFIKFFCHSI